MTLENLLKTADVVSFHTALVPATHHLLNAENIKLMKDDAIVVNTSRGAVIDNDAVAAALCAGKLWGAASTCSSTSRSRRTPPSCTRPHTVLTSHAAYWSEESAVELRQRCTQNAIDVVCGRTPEACVNPAALSRALAK